jgi:hypothetical protein
MAPRKTFPLRLDPAVYDSLQRWADAELRSVNAHIEFLLRRALQESGRLPKQDKSKLLEQEEMGIQGDPRKDDGA